MTQVYYCKQTESPSSQHRIAPAPIVSISPEIYYANDSVVGYTYMITLNGYANALRKEIDPNSMNYGLEPTVDHMGDIREILNTNGGDLYVKQGNSTILKAKGGTIKKLDFNESDNKWVNYSPFTAEIEFNEIDFSGCSSGSTIACNSSIFHNQDGAKSISDNLIDIKLYKIKEFNDKWTFTIEDTIYDNYSGLYNNIFRVSYNISATGKNYYINDNLIPAWEQAKLFVQDRLRKQVTSLINGNLQIVPSNDSASGAAQDITQIHSVDNSSPRSSGMLQGFSTLRDGSPTYDIYNETITCDTSESDGTFSVNYTAILKKYDSSLSPLENAALHKYSHDLSIASDASLDASITIQGTITGLTRGGFIYYDFNDFTLPANGTFITSLDSAETRYGNAISYYNAKIGSSSDLLQSFKDKVKVKKSQLLIKGTDGYPTPASFTLDHNYNEGSLTYNASYNKKLANAIDKGFTNISITRNDPVDIIQEFIVPGRSAGPIIQRIGAKTARTVSVTIDGSHPNNKMCIIDICNFLPYVNIPNIQTLLNDTNTWIKTREDYTTNTLDGSFSISLEYTCKGCN